MRLQDITKGNIHSGEVPTHRMTFIDKYGGSVSVPLLCKNGDIEAYRDAYEEYMEKWKDREDMIRCEILRYDRWESPKLSLIGSIKL